MPHADPEARRAYNRAHYAANRERLLAEKATPEFRAADAARKRAARLRDPDSFRAYERSKRAKNLEVYRERDRARRNTPEARAAYNRWERENPNKAERDARRNASAAEKYARDPSVREYHREWAAKNPAKVREHATRAGQVRRARKNKAPVIEFIDRGAVIERDASTCYLCGHPVEESNIEIDHVVPLARGGEHTYANLRVACQRCNRRKGTKLVSECEWAIP